jgi:hypothetical protein
MAFTNLGKYEEVMNAADSAIKIDPISADAWANKGSVLLFQGGIRQGPYLKHHLLRIKIMACFVH